MATFDEKPIVDALSLPLGELIASVGRGVAEAQREMDAGSIAAMQDIYSRGDGLFLELQRIGYRPTWYHIPEAEGDLQIAITATSEQTSGSTGVATGSGATPGAQRIKLYASPVDAGYASRFAFNVQASSRVKFRIVPVPASTVAESLQVVPALVGLSVGEARARLALLNIPSTVSADAKDDATVTGQVPAPGTLLSSGNSVTVRTG
jgi:PASTA domain-containing protein